LTFGLSVKVNYFTFKNAQVDSEVTPGDDNEVFSVSRICRIRNVNHILSLLIFFPHTVCYNNCASEIPHVYLPVANGLIFKLALTFVQHFMCDAARKLRLTDGKKYIYIKHIQELTPRETRE
jgi:hypothetical protein